MATNEGVLVRCSPELLRAIDEVRGERTRAEFLRRSGERAAEGERLRQAGQQILDPLRIAEREITRRSSSSSTRFAASGRPPPPREVIRPSECSHPPNQRIGNVCMVCDTKVGK